MSEVPCFTYWTVECKSGMSEILVLALIGPCHLGRIPYLAQCRNFEVVCSVCGVAHRYSRDDVRWKDLPLEPPLGFRADPAFVEATLPEPHPDGEEH